MKSTFKKHDYLFCIDSDGTIMDSMTIKHKKCFGPAFIETFNIKEHQEEILKEWNEINLYRSTRGINRFQGLKEILEFIKLNYSLTFPGTKEFNDWVNTTPRFDIKLLEQEILKVKENQTLKLALNWSKLVNEKIKLLPMADIFPSCIDTLNELATFADLIGVSSANKDAVNKEWEEKNIKQLFIDVCCQDVGTKSDIILKALSLGYEKDNVIMIGDALGDLNAAMDNGVHFYPIIPTKEDDCWEQLKLLALTIKTGGYKSIEPQLINQFLFLLSHGGN